MKTFDHSKEAEDPSFGGCSMICIPFRQPEVPLKCVFVIFGAQNPKNYPKSVSHEPDVVESQLTTQKKRKTQVNGGVLRYVYPFDNWKGPKNAFL